MWYAYTMQFYSTMKGNESTDLHLNMEEPQKHYLNERSPARKTAHCMTLLYKMFRKDKSIETESRFTVA